MIKLKKVKVMSEQEKRLSYQYSTWYMLGNMLMAVLFCSVFWTRFAMTDFEHSLISGLQIAVALFFVVLVISQLLYQCTAYVRQDKLVLKKLFRDEQQYTFKQIVKVKKYNLSRVHYVVVTMRNANGTTEKYMIMNIYTWYAQSRYDAKEVLEELKSKG
ncbi:hypothetical protein [Myroides marinus]|uniref:hypothetical protein n=1 Tax=Myroides marinus TaxID=703342 RepID=UPI0025754768|nr:hypothetical protein [Myroides marinus]MDM1367907.1 hypothetical protein [Myroides marinus]MDM1375288.1 hypothetical protein [Myroides marinus]MDM1377569.1 hypothetical protein [Myroides marinus]MDM1382480.1 hypothetical protein [Myroides marinus]MDM1384751.1 hypothetical protein [Myroides marinus]